MKISKIFTLSLFVFIVGCASKTRVIDDLNQLPATASSGDLELSAHVWTGVGGKPVRNLVIEATYPHSPTSIERITTLSFPDSRGDKYGQRIAGLLKIEVTGDYQFLLSADESAELWLSSDEAPHNKRLIAYTNKPTGYKVWTTYNSQQSDLISLVAGERYFLEVLHKEYTRHDYLNVSWNGPGFSEQDITDQHLLPMGQADQVSGETAFKEGYHTGYTAGTYLATYDDTYPPVDTDGDGLPDFYEVLTGSNIEDITDAYLDVDGDLLTAYEEYQIITNPSADDTDGDGIPDGYEFVYGLNALDASDAVLDLDNDGISNIDEYIAGTAPDDQADFPAPDITSTLVTLNWSIPTAREDGSPLSVSEISGYRIYSGASADSLSLLDNISDAQHVSYSIQLEEGQYFFAISTITTDDVEGVKSQTISVSVGSTGIVEVIYPEGPEGVNGGSELAGSDGSDPVEVDTDGDGMSDAFELQYGFNPNDPSDALLDADGDGVTNLDEFIAGSDPAETLVSSPKIVTLTWDMPNLREDGSILATGDIESYRIYSGTSSDAMTSLHEVTNPQTLSYEQELPQGTHYFAISTVTTDGYESVMSDTVTVTVQ